MNAGQLRSHQWLHFTKCITLICCVSLYFGVARVAGAADPDSTTPVGHPETIPEWQGIPLPTTEEMQEIIERIELSHEHDDFADPPDTWKFTVGLAPSSDSDEESEFDPCAMLGKLGFFLNYSTEDASVSGICLHAGRPIQPEQVILLAEYPEAQVARGEFNLTERHSIPMGANCFWESGYFSVLGSGSLLSPVEAWELANGETLRSRIVGSENEDLVAPLNVRQTFRDMLQLWAGIDSGMLVPPFSQFSLEDEAVDS